MHLSDEEVIDIVDRALHKHGEQAQYGSPSRSLAHAPSIDGRMVGTVLVIIGVAALIVLSGGTATAPALGIGAAALGGLYLMPESKPKLGG